MSVFQYVNNQQTTLSGAITAGATTINVTSAAGWPSQGKFTIVVDSEIMLVTGVAGTVWTVTRGYENTLAAAHNNNASVTHVLTATSLVNVQHTDVRSYGAKGDGVTDDTAAIQAAINDVTAAGGVLYLPQGTYQISSVLNIPYSAGWTIRGAGMDATTIRQTTNNTGIILLAESGENRWQITDLALTWATAQTGNTGAFAIGFANGGALPDGWGHYDFTIERISFSNGYLGIGQTAAAAVVDPIWGCAIRDLRFYANWCGPTIAIKQTDAGQPNVRVERVLQYLNNVTTTPMQFSGIQGLYLSAVESLSGTQAVEISLETCQAFQIEGVRSEFATITSAFNGLLTIVGSFGVINGYEVMSPTTNVTSGQFTFALRIIIGSQVTVNNFVVQTHIDTSGNMRGIAAHDAVAVTLDAATATSCTLIYTGDNTPTNVFGFYGGIGKPTITGSRGGNAALASLLSQLSSLGLITDSSSA